MVQGPGFPQTLNLPSPSYRMQDGAGLISRDLARLLPSVVGGNVTGAPGQAGLMGLGDVGDTPCGVCQVG